RPIPRDPPVTMAIRSFSENNSLMVGTWSGLYFENFYDANAGHDERRQVPHDVGARRRRLHARRAHRRTASLRSDRRGIHAERGAARRRPPLQARLDAHTRAAEEG